jgi:hypothetical protein
VKWTRLENKTGGRAGRAAGRAPWQIWRADGGWHVSQDGKRLTQKPVPYAQAGTLVLDAAKAVA